MDESVLTITYVFTFSGNREESFEIRLDPETIEAVDPLPDALPDWTQLEFHKCVHCPLNSDKHSHCPLAARISGIVDRFTEIISYQEIRVAVKTAERIVLKETTAQVGLSALLGLVMATSACPVLSKLKSQAYFHLPFATIEESIMRTVSSYLLKQYFLEREGYDPDWELKELNRYYQILQEVNISLKKRIDVASLNDANMNAVSSLGMLSIAVSFSLEDQLEEIRDTFLRETPTESLP